jgi:catechol 2,3-dioxygenase-like lactoylglutathione lyase family enzyme
MSLRRPSARCAGALLCVGLGIGASAVAGTESSSGLRGSAPAVAEETGMFERIDTVLLRVRDVARAAVWYREKLGLTLRFADDTQRLVVLRVAADHTLTLWELQAGETPPAASAAGTYPILAVGDAAAARARLAAAGVVTGPLEESPGVRTFAFFDPDGNRLEACETL